MKIRVYPGDIVRAKRDLFVFGNQLCFHQTGNQYFRRGTIFLCAGMKNTQIYDATVCELKLLAPNGALYRISKYTMYHFHRWFTTSAKPFHGCD